MGWQQPGLSLEDALQYLWLYLKDRASVHETSRPRASVSVAAEGLKGAPFLEVRKQSNVYVKTDTNMEP
jgi:hypothetical protein